MSRQTWQDIKKQSKDRNRNNWVKPDDVVNIGGITVHRNNATLFAECMAKSVHNCIQAPFAKVCSMTITMAPRLQLH